MKYPQTNRLRSFYIFAGYYCMFILEVKILTNGSVERNFSNYVDNVGWIYPSGEVIKRVGQNLKIFCTINLKSARVTNSSSTNLKFIKDGRVLDSHNVTEVHETTISLYLSNGNESDHVYECAIFETDKKLSSLTSQEIQLNNSNISVSPLSNSNYKSVTSFGKIHVVVGDKPKDALDFRCILYHWSILRCFWTVQKNYVRTNFAIQFIPLTIVRIEECAPSNRTIIKKPSMCPNNNDNMNSTCLWSSITRPRYSNIYEKLNVTLIGKNEFGENEQQFIFDQFKHMRPEAPSGFYNHTVTSNSVTLRWYVDNLQHVHVDWIYEISLWENSTWSTFFHSSKNLTKSGEYFFYTFNNLTPYTLYNFYISMKLLSSPPFDEYWSDYTQIEVQTKPLPATYVPETDVGLFYITEEETFFRQVNIYWKPMEYSSFYGDIHNEIKVLEVDESGNEQLAVNASLIEIFDESAIFSIGPSCYHFFVRTANSEGTAPNASVITVPAKKSVIHIPMLFYVTITPRIRNTHYYLECIWILPQEKPHVENYTIFWRWYYQNSNREVNGNVNTSWIVLPVNITKHKIRIDYDEHLTAENFYSTYWNVYINVNTKNSSTGLNSFDSIVYSRSNLSELIVSTYLHLLPNWPSPIFL